MKKSVIAITIISSLFIFQECKRDNGDVTPTPTDTTHHVVVPPIDSSKYVPNTGDSTCFNSQIYPLIMSNCAMSNCHDSKTKQKGYDLSTYANIARFAYPINASIITDKMPKGLPPLSASQKAMYWKWVTEGAHKVVCDTNACDTTNVTYTACIQPLVQNYCGGCHNSTSTGGGILLNTYDNVKSSVQFGNLLCSIQWTNSCKRMPQNSGQLTSCNIRKFIIWKNNNYPQ